MSAWHFYSLSTGLFMPGSMQLPSEAAVAANTPPGHVAIHGDYDHTRQRMDTSGASHHPVAYQPPAPADDALRTWAWDAQAWAWKPAPTPLAAASAARAERDRRLAACDWVVLRALESGTPAGGPWTAYRQALRNIPQQHGFPHAINWPQEPAT